MADDVGAPPFLRPGWFEAWWRAFGSGQLDIATLRRAGRLVAVLPLRRRRGALLSPTNWHAPGFGPVGEPASATVLIRRVFAGLGRTHRVSLSLVDPAAAETDIWRAALEAQGFRVLTRSPGRWAGVEIDGDWCGYERALSRNTRSGLKRGRRRLDQAGQVSFDQVDGTEDLERLLAEGFAVEASGWKASRGTAIGSRPETERFYRDLAGWAARTGRLRLAFLRVERRPVAFEFALEDGGVHYALKSGFDPTYAACSPGRLVIHRSLELAFGRGLTRFELAGVEPYKLAWANSFRDLIVFQAFAPSPAGLAGWAAFRYGHPAAKRVVASLPSRRSIG